MYCRAANGDSPIISGLGDFNELRSKYVPPSSHIRIECLYSDGKKGVLDLTEKKYKKPSKFPLNIYISAERFGPRVSLPLDIGYKNHPDVGSEGQYVAGFIEALQDCVIPPVLRHPKAEGFTLNYQIRAWIAEFAPGAEFGFSVDKKTDSGTLQFNDFRPTNAGFGLSYSLPIIAAILGCASKKLDGPWDGPWDEHWESAREKDGLLLIIENPEAHLHPSAQTAIGKLIAKGAAAGVQMVIETQSEHVMDGVRLFAKEHEGFQNNVKFNYLTRGENGISVVDSPILSQSGRLSHWPKGFFDQAIKNKIELSK